MNERLSIALSIIIVNYRSGKLVADAIRSVQKFNSNIQYEIIIVDNDSSDESKEEIMACGKNIVWLQMPYNAGFARANNAGMKTADGDVFVLLNANTRAVDNSIEQC